MKKLKITDLSDGFLVRELNKALEVLVWAKRYPKRGRAERPAYPGRTLGRIAIELRRRHPELPAEQLLTWMGLVK